MSALPGYKGLMSRCPLHWRTLRPALFALLAAPGTLLAQGTPQGPEFRVNSYTIGSQSWPKVATDWVGNFVVVWTSSGQDGSNDGVFGQRYASSGAPLGGEFRVNSFTTSNQNVPAVASDSAGNFVVTWESLGQDGSSWGVFAQRYANTGAPLGGEFRVNTYTTGHQSGPSVASDSAGNFVIAWTSFDGTYVSLSNVVAQRYASSGTPLGGEFEVNEPPVIHQAGPSVASDSAGNFVVVWTSYCCTYYSLGHIAGRQFTSSGTPVSGEFQVNDCCNQTEPRFPSVASDSAGNFIVAWAHIDLPPYNYNVHARRYHASSGWGPQSVVNSYHTGWQFLPSVSSDSAGNYIVVWDSDQDSGGGVFAQRYAISGDPLGGEFRVNTYTTFGQGSPSVASDSAGNFVVVWWSSGQDGSNAGIFAQRYSMIVPVELLGFRVE